MEDMIRKKPLSHVTRESTSSEETVPSKPPKDVLGLGMHLVRELSTSRSNDTLGRWLSHHVAELMNAVDGAKSPEEKAQKLNDATDLILRIWERRNALPGEANPLGRFREAITILLKYEDPYSHFSNAQIPT